jgi:hypothetical protein
MRHGEQPPKLVAERVVSNVCLSCIGRHFDDSGDPVVSLEIVKREAATA